MTFDHQAQSAALLAHIQQQGPITDLADLTQRHQERRELEHHLQALADFIHLTRRNLGQCRKLPRLDLVQWAQEVLAFPNVALLEVDTSGLDANAEVLRVLLLNKHRTVLYDTCITPTRRPLPNVLHLNGLDMEDDLQHAPSAEAVWDELRAALMGKYLISFNRDFDCNALNALAKRLNQRELTLIGADLMTTAQEYFSLQGYPKLVTLCERLGKPLPMPPAQTALHRAMGQLDLLEAMTQGQTASPLASIETMDVLTSDDPPF